MNDKKCLIIIDVQNGIFNLKQPVFNQEKLIKNLKIILEKARNRDYFVVFTQHENKTFLKRNTTGWEIVEELKPNTSDTVIFKSHPSVFEETQLDSILRKEGIKNLYLCGLITNGCVKQACEDAIVKGYQITLISDAHSTFNKKPEHIIKELNNRIIEIGGQIVDTKSISKL